MEQLTDVTMEWSIRIPLRDGASLHAILYRPKDRVTPAIFAMTPYTAQYHHQHGMYFASHGYSFVSVDVRGRGESDGIFDPRNEARDGKDVCAWLSRQSYCDGSVAMWGGSYLGRCQWACASEMAPLTTITPVAAPFYSVDVPMRNNVFAINTIRWLSMVSGRALNDRIFADQALWMSKFKSCFKSESILQELDRSTGRPDRLFQEWISHPFIDAYWEGYEPTTDQYAQMSLPVLTITGAYDGDQLGALEHYRRHIMSASPQSRAKHFLIIGPWDHAGTSAPKTEFAGVKAGPDSQLNMPQLHLQWYDWIMRAGPRPEFLKKNVAYYVTGSERWCYCDSLAEVTTRSELLYLSSARSPVDSEPSIHPSLVSERPEPSSPDGYEYDPRDVDHAELESEIDPENLVDQRLFRVLGRKQLVYDTAPFGNGLEIAGFFKLNVWISINQLDTDFRVSIYEVLADGSVLFLTSDWMRARYRAGLREERLVKTTTPLCYTFERFTFVARYVRRGHRLRMVIGPINSIYWQKNYNSGRGVATESIADARVVRVRVFHDEVHASVLTMPIGEREL